jgi:hypothetical protein
MRNRTVLATYPDACFVQCHREPSKVLPSLCSLVAGWRAIYEGGVDRRSIVRSQAELWAAGMEHGMEVRREVEPSRFLDLHFRDVLADPVAAVRRIYAHFDVPLSEEAERRFRAWKQDNPRGKHGEHRYAAEDFGTTEEAINDRFAAYISHFSIPRVKCPHFLEESGAQSPWNSTSVEEDNLRASTAHRTRIAASRRARRYRAAVDDARGRATAASEALRSRDPRQRVRRLPARLRCVAARSRASGGRRCGGDVVARAPATCSSTSIARARRRDRARRSVRRASRIPQLGLRGRRLRRSRRARVSWSRQNPQIRGRLCG